MNYENHYRMLIERSKTRILEGYVEKHHIIPKCMGGSDERDNIAILTPEEHFVAHQLLIKMHPGNRDLIYATQLMTTHQSGERINNKLFGWIRKQCALAMSIKSKAWIAENGHPRGMLGKKHTEESNIRRSAKCKKIKMESIGINVFAYNLDGTFYKKYNTLTECAKDLNTNPSNVKYTAAGKFGHCKGKQLRYEYTETITPYVKSSPMKGKKKSEEHCKNISIAKKGKKMPLGWGEKHSEAMKDYHKRKKEQKK